MYHSVDIGKVDWICTWLLFVYAAWRLADFRRSIWAK